MEKQLIGTATKPQALKGQFRIKPSISNFKLFKKLKTLIVDDKEYLIETCSIRDTFVIIKLQGADTCEDAELFRNKKVFAEIELNVETNSDLTSFEVVINNEVIGNIVEVNNYGSKDILSIQGDKNIMVPVIEQLIIYTDVDEKKVVLDGNIFEQVAVYEDWYFNVISWDVWTIKN